METVRPSLTILEQCSAVFPTSLSPFFSCRCKSGVNITGTKTSDIVCNDEKPKTGTDANVSPIPVKAVSSDTAHQPQETFQTQRLLTTTTNRQIQHPETSPPSTADPLGKTHPAAPVRTPIKKTHQNNCGSFLCRFPRHHCNCWPAGVDRHEHQVLRWLLPGKG